MNYSTWLAYLTRALSVGNTATFGDAVISGEFEGGSDQNRRSAGRLGCYVISLSQEILRTDVSGMPLEWIDYRDAVRLYHTEQVAYACGTPLYRLFGGTSARTGLRTVVDVSSIIATTGHSHNPGNLRGDYTPPLNNQTLFKRDAHLCLYCGHRFPSNLLSRDHIRPLSQGGRDTWTNVATACRRCNNLKASQTPEEAGLQLIAVPFKPTYAEYIYLKGRRVLADQMEYLLAHFPRTSPLHARLRRLEA